MFKGTYYNHEVARAIPADIQLFTESLQLDLTGDGRPARKLHWLFTELSVEAGAGHFLRITYTGAESGTLEVSDPVFVKTFLQKYKHTRSPGLHQLVLRGGLKTSLIMLLVLAAVLLAGHFYVLPWCVNRIVDRLPLSFDQKLGEAARASIHEVPDTAGSRLLTAFAREINWGAPQQLTFSVVQSDVENAYALPGGYIVVYTGLLKKMRTPEQLAALLSHEAAHISGRHGMRNLCRNMGTAMVVAVTFGGSSATNTLYANAGSLYNLTYSRQYEREADITGMATLRRNHINQQGMLQLLQELQKPDQGINVPEFIRTHPLTENRIEYARRDAEEHTARFKKNERMERAFWELVGLYGKN